MSRKNFEIITFLRGYSITTIILFHLLQFMSLPAPWDRLISFGGTGVHLFVLLSGFGLYYSHLHKPLTFLPFLKKRMTKVYVPYIAVVLLSAAVSLVRPIYPNSWFALGGHIFLYKMFNESIMGSYGYHLWFISMILQFYLVFHLLAWLQAQLQASTFLLTTLLLSLLWATTVLLLGKGSIRVWNSFFLQFLWEFALGMWMAKRIYTTGVLTSKTWKWPGTLVLAILNLLIYSLLALKGGQWGMLFNDIFALSGYGLLAASLYMMRLPGMRTVLHFIGRISLSMYLLHFLVLLSLAAFLPDNPKYQIVLFTLAVLIPLSMLYQRVVEWFFTKMKL